MRDQYGREVDYLRLSVTDRCGFRCRYCVSGSGAPSLPEGDLLTDDELERVVRAAASLGVTRLKLTGGEPLARPGLAALAARLGAVPGIRSLTLTTNGAALAPLARDLRAAGVREVNVSLDTLDRARFRALTGVDALDRVLAGLDAAVEAGFDRVKVNCVTGEDLDQGDPAALAELARARAVDVRYIESMPIGCGHTFHPVTRAELARRLAERYGPLIPAGERGNGPAEYYRIRGFAGRIGFISAVSEPFCAGCNRIRLTPDGQFKPCLQYRPTLDVRALLRGGAADGELCAALREAVWHKPRAHRFAQPAAGENLEERPMSAIGG